MVYIWERRASQELPKCHVVTVCFRPNKIRTRLLFDFWQHITWEQMETLIWTINYTMVKLCSIHFAV